MEQIGKRHRRGLRQGLLHYSDLVIFDTGLKPARFLGWKFIQAKPSQSHSRHPIVFTLS
jgi:hypothetical protein